MERRRGRAREALAVGIGLASLCGCYSIRSSAGGGEVDVPPQQRGRLIRTADIALPPGYVIEAVARGLTMPTDVAIDEQGRVFVIEAGYGYGDNRATPQLLEVTGGRRRVVATGKNPPWNGMTLHQGDFYVAEGGFDEGGRIVKISASGEVTTLIEGMPSQGDHHTNAPVIGPDGMLYFGQGTVTNSGVVGIDNHEFGWLAKRPALHDVPCRDVKLDGHNFTTPNPLTPVDDDEVETGAFVPFGTVTEPGQIVPGELPCSGAVMRLPLAGGPVELVAWGFRNPFGLTFAPDGRLFVADNAYDDRGSRPIFGTGDYLWAVTPGTWYGWPDYAGGRFIADERFRPPGKPAVPRLLAEIPNRPPRPAAEFGVHSSSNGFDFSRNPAFGHVGEAFVAQFGDMAPETGKVFDPVGFRVVRVDIATGVIESFAANKGKTNGPASLYEAGGFERPVHARFNPAGDALYVVDFGVLTMEEGKPMHRKESGVLWKISRGGR
jgi:glucose/arabinose dehydrogenase